MSEGIQDGKIYMSEPTALEKWWDETFPKVKEKKVKTAQDAILRLLRGTRGHRFANRAMDRGVQIATAARRIPARERAERRKLA
jgi:hypothetical protein